MTRDTRPDQHTRHIDVPTDPIEQKRDALKADRLELTATDFRREDRIVVADLLTGIAMSLRGEGPVTSSPIVRTAHAWVSMERSIEDDAEWARVLVLAAANSMNFRSAATADFLRGVAMALGGTTKAPIDAASTFRMGMKGVIECERGRPQYTQLAVAAPEEASAPRPPPIITEDPLEHEATRPHAAAVEADNEPTRQHVEANPVPPPLLEHVVRAPVRDPDAPVPRRGRAAAGDDDLTSARLIPRTEILKAPK